MPDLLRCYRCGANLEKLSLPLSRQDLCPGCSASVRVCRMCGHFDPRVPKQCREDDAEEVLDKELANFCEWFAPSADAFDPVRAGRTAKAQADLAALFGESGAAGDAGDPDADAALRRAHDLFK